MSSLYLLILMFIPYLDVYSDGQSYLDAYSDVEIILIIMMPRYAEKMYMRALEGREKALGAEHTSTLNTINNLGCLYRAKGKLVEVEEVFMRALEGKEKLLDAEHISILRTVNNLGLLYVD